MAPSLPLLLLGSLLAAHSTHALSVYTPDYVNHRDGLDHLCKGLDSVQIGHPDDCQKFVVCCQERALPYVCHLPLTPGYYILEYSPAFRVGAATYNPVTGECEERPTPVPCEGDVLNQVPSTRMCLLMAGLEANVGLITTARLLPASEGSQGLQTTGTNLLLHGDPVQHSALPELTDTRANVAGDVAIGVVAPYGRAAAAAPPAATTATPTAPAVAAPVAAAPARVPVATTPATLAGAPVVVPVVTPTAPLGAAAVTPPGVAPVTPLPGTPVDPVAADRAAVAVTEPKYRPGRWALIINGRTGKSSTGALAIHAVLLPFSDRVLVASRALGDWPNSKYEPGMTITSTGRRLGQVSAVYDTNSGHYTVAPVLSSPFCMGHSYLANGTIITAGGDPASYTQHGAGPLREGRNVIRTFTQQTGWVDSTTKLKGYHWYPTLLTLPDQRVIIANGVMDPDVGNTQPLVEVYDPATNEIVSADSYTPMRTYKLYPALLLLPWTPQPGQYLLYSFDGCTKPVIMTMDKGNRLRTYKEPVDTFGVLGNFCSQNSAQAPATLLMLRPQDDYAAEVVQFGGFSLLPPGEACFCDYPAAGQSVRMKLDRATTEADENYWIAEQMPKPRVGADAVVLPNGKVIIVNGAEKGQMQGGIYGGSQSKDSVYEAWLYDPYAALGERYTVLAASTILRAYHSSALLLPDASVMVAGSEQTECVSGCPVPAPVLIQYQAEKYLPYYFYDGRRPLLHTWNNPSTAVMGKTITVLFKGTANRATIVAPAAVTHQLNMNQRVVELEMKVTGYAPRGYTSATLTMPPPSALVAPAGPYMLFVLRNDIPCKKAVWITLTQF